VARICGGGARRGEARTILRSAPIRARTSPGMPAPSLFFCCARWSAPNPNKTIFFGSESSCIILPTNFDFVCKSYGMYGRMFLPPRHGFRVRFLGIGICDLFFAICSNDSRIYLMRLIPVNRWVVLGKSNIVPADLAAASAAWQPRLNFSPLPDDTYLVQIGASNFLSLFFV